MSELRGPLALLFSSSFRPSLILFFTSLPPSLWTISVNLCPHLLSSPGYLLHICLPSPLFLCCFCLFSNVLFFLSYFVFLWGFLTMFAFFSPFYFSASSIFPCFFFLSHSIGLKALLCTNKPQKNGDAKTSPVVISIVSHYKSIRAILNMSWIHFSKEPD